MWCVNVKLPLWSQKIWQCKPGLRVNPTEIYDDPWNPIILTMLTCCVIIIFVII